MVLTLSELCLISIRNGIENDQIRHSHLLPPKLRQPLLDLVLMHGKINRPNCIESLSSMDFLSELTSFDTQNGNLDDRRYLDAVSESLGREPSVIKKLKVNCYGRYVFRSDPICTFEPTTLSNVVRLVSQCGDLQSLCIRVLECTEFIAYPGDHGREVMDAFLLNRCAITDPWLSVLQNVLDLKLVGCGDATVFLTEVHPIAEFRQLSFLTLVNCRVEAKAWSDLLATVQDTLIRLYLEDVLEPDFTEETAWILPFPMPNLESLEIHHNPQTRYRWDMSLTRQILGCPSLKYVCATLSKLSNDNGGLTMLERHSIDLQIKICIASRDRRSDEDSYLDADSHFRLVRIFSHHIRAIDLSLRHWNARLTTALEHAVSACPNLEEFRFDSEFIARDEELAAGKATLAPLFSDGMRASKLTKLALTGDFESGLLTAVFENCVNLVSLKVCNCPALNDGHLILWASHGGSLSTLVLLNCSQISDEGIIPILVNSGKKLASFTFGTSNPSRSGVTERTWTMLLNRCPYVEFIKGIPDSLEDVVHKSCHKNLRKIGTRMYSHES